MRPETDFPTDLRALESDYELIRELGQGGMAAVYLARRRATGTPVAIKAIRARYLDDPDALRRFAREARTVADLDHPNIVRTEAIEQIGDRAVAIIMEYFPGGTVRDRLREFGAFVPEEAESVLRDVATALSYAHRRGIVHRDVKPENVFLDVARPRALLSDFGIARRIEGDVPITLLGSALGTPQYMSPEQIDGRRVDGRSDIYSLGVLGWELLTGRRPWAGENLYSVIYKQKHEDLPRITSLRPRVPANLLFAIEGALAKDPAYRWQSAEEFLEHLTYNPPPVLAQSYPAGATPPDDEPTVRFRRDGRVAAMSAGHEPRADAGLATAGSRSRDERPRMPTDTGTPRREARVVPPRRRQSRRIATWLALLVPLAVAGTAFHVVTRGAERAPSGGEASGTLTSGGSVALDTIPPAASTRPADTTGPSRPDTVTERVGNRAEPRADSSRSQRTEVAAPTRTRAVDTLAKARQRSPSTADSVPARRDVPRSDSARRDTAPARTDTAPPAGPSPRCRVASMADQRACLLAYIAVNDAPLQRVYDSLIVELRRVAGVRSGQPDPPAVTRLRVEQRTWVSLRDDECTRDPVPGSIPYWAEPLAVCFARMSAARAAELEEALQRVRGQTR